MEIPLSLVRRDDLVLCSESEELKVMVGCFVQICSRKENVCQAIKDINGVMLKNKEEASNR